MPTPSELLLSFYGDDFTGTTDGMEALALSGLRTVLFIDPPRPEQMARFPGLRAVGVAGVSRSLRPEEMEAELRPVFAALRALNTPLVHYKLCSTFDSSPHIGSIGKAIELGREAYGTQVVPLLVAAPVLGRYQAFGNLFARSGGDSEVYRLDQHPTMRQHPVTPMRESDLRRHLAQQTSHSIALFDVLKLELPINDVEQRFASLLATGAEIVLFDTMTDAHLSTIGRLLWQQAVKKPPLFAAGSSGIEYALTACWRETGLLPPLPPHRTFGPSSPLLIVSGSCSPVTERQIAHAVANGFEEIALDPPALLANAPLAQTAVQDQATRALNAGRSVILHVSRGPNDPRFTETMRFLEQSGQRQQGGKLLGQALGRLLRAVLVVTTVPRVVVTGGDTSGYVARELDIEALEMLAPVAPGSPLCRAYSSQPRIDGLEILFKGG